MRTHRLLALLLWGLAASAAAELPDIHPAGIRGTLILGGAKSIKPALNTFMKAAGGEDAKILVITTDDPTATCETLRVMRQLAPDVTVQASRETDPATAIQGMTGLWLTGSNLQGLRDLAQDTNLREALDTFLKSGQVIGATGMPTQTLGTFHDDANPGLKQLPDAVIGHPYPGSVIKRFPHIVAYELEEDAALLIHGRLLRSIGAGRIDIRRNLRNGEPPVTLTLSPEHPLADLTALRRTARDSTLQRPTKAPKPNVRNGTLILIGGGGMPAGIVDRFVKLAGGQDARIVVLPTAVPDPIRKPYRIDETFRKAGAGKVTVLPGRTLKKVESAEYLAAFKEATGLWFGGGRQWRFVDAYLGTRAHPLMHDVLRRGGVVMGSSAGASIQAEYLARGNPLGNLKVMAPGYERGLNVLHGTAVDQHFSQRNRFEDLKKLTQAHPRLLGIGIDESTALIVRKKIGAVAGKGKVFFYDNRTGSNPKQIAIPNGGRFNLTARKVVDVSK